MCQSCPAHTCIPSCWPPVCPFAVKLVGPWRRFPGCRRVLVPARLAELRSGRLLGVPWPSPGRPRRSARPGRGLGPSACLVGPRPPACTGAAVRPPRNDSIPREEKQDVVQHTRCVTSKSRNAFVQGVFFVPGMLLYPWEPKGAVQKHS